jgi:hypothetical protein
MNGMHTYRKTDVSAASASTDKKLKAFSKSLDSIAASLSKELLDCNKLDAKASLALKQLNIAAPSKP